MSDRELYLNVDLAKAPAGTRVEVKNTTARFKAKNGESTGLCSATDVDTYIALGILREVPPKWAGDDEMVKFGSYLLDQYIENYVPPGEADILDELKIFRAKEGL